MFAIILYQQILQQTNIRNIKTKQTYYGTLCTIHIREYTENQGNEIADKNVRINYN